MEYKELMRLHGFNEDMKVAQLISIDDYHFEHEKETFITGYEIAANKRHYLDTKIEAVQKTFIRREDIEGGIINYPEANDIVIAGFNYALNDPARKLQFVKLDLENKIIKLACSNITCHFLSQPEVPVYPNELSILTRKYGGKQLPELELDEVFVEAYHYIMHGVNFGFYYGYLLEAQENYHRYGNIEGPQKSDIPTEEELEEIRTEENNYVPLTAAAHKFTLLHELGIIRYLEKQTKFGDLKTNTQRIKLLMLLIGGKGKDYASIKRHLSVHDLPNHKKTALTDAAKNNVERVLRLNGIELDDVVDRKVVIKVKKD